MMRKVTMGMFMAVMFLAGVSAAAEPSDTDRLRKEVAELARRVQELEGAKGSAPGDKESWADRIEFSGDFRYRHEFIDEEDKDERTRHRIRTRVYLKAKVNEDVSFGLRVASGSEDPVSTNQTLDGGFTSKRVWIDRAYATYSPSALKDYGVELTAGKIKNPFHMPGKTELIWDGDLNPEGGAFRFRREIEPVTVFGSAAGLWIEERSADAGSALWGVQGGVEVPLADTGVKVVAGVSGFFYTHTVGNEVFVDSEDSFGNSATQVGDDFFYDEEYKLVEAFGEVRFAVREVPVAVFFDFVTNTEADEEDTGWLVGVAVGKKKNPGDWDFKLNYREVEKDAVVGAFTDSDFGGGGTNAEGIEVGAGIRLLKNMDLGVTWFSNDLNIASGEDEKEYDRVQIDLKLKF